MSADVLIVDYGIGNLGSIRNALARVGRSAEISGEPEAIDRAERLILPGVGAFDHAMLRLRQLRLEAPLRRAALDRRVPLAGVCLGMQLLLDGSEEGSEPGLGLIPGHARRFPDQVAGRRLLVPHMGWNTVDVAKPSRFIGSLADGNRYYFVHSYAVQTTDPADVLTWTTYGERFASSIERENVLGIQFHPEKSHRFGLALLDDFAGAK
ncbi:imidazole glycerol phosphate synthase subunit HisH [Agromyces bauzanensis]